MSQTIHIMVDIDRPAVEKQVFDILKELPHVEVDASRQMKDRDIAAINKADADIMLLDEASKEGDFVNYLEVMQQQYPHTAMFVISPDHSPRNIVRLMKAGAGEFISNPVSAGNLIDAIEEFRARRNQAKRQNKGRICSFISCKGGLGSSVLSVNTATALSLQKKHSIALVDMSLRAGDQSVMLDVVPNNSIADLSRNIHRLDVSLFRGALARQQTGVDFLAAPQQPSDADAISEDHVKKILNLASQLNDYVLADCPSMHVDECTKAVLELSSVIFIVVDLSVSSIRNASRLVQHIEKLGINPDRIAITVNRYVKGSALSIDEVEKATRRPVFWIFPNEFAPVMSSINQGIPLVRLNPKSIFSRNVKDFVAKLKDPAAHGDYRGIKGTFGKAI